MDVTLQELYDEACRALGESIVVQRILTKELTKHESSGQPDDNTGTQPGL